MEISVMRHLSYLECDRCGARSETGETGPQARALAERAGWDYRNWNRRLRDLCARCAAPTPRIEPPDRPEPLPNPVIPSI